MYFGVIVSSETSHRSENDSLQNSESFLLLLLSKTTPELLGVPLRMGSVRGKHRQSKQLRASSTLSYSEAASLHRRLLDSSTWGSRIGASCCSRSCCSSGPSSTSVRSSTRTDCTRTRAAKDTLRGPRALLHQC